MPAGADHFGRRESAGVFVDLYRRRRGLVDEFRVEVDDKRHGTRFVLYPMTGREAIQAFYHPFTAVDARTTTDARAA
jgi:hypothetical protein